MTGRISMMCLVQFPTHTYGIEQGSSLGGRADDGNELSKPSDPEEVEHILQLAGCQ